MIKTPRLMQFLTWSLIAGVSGMVSLLAMEVEEASTLGGAVCAVTMIAGSIAFYICLGILANRMGRRWITWVALTFITKPVGPFVAYFKMRGLVKNHKD